ncbi:hypothetical protein GZL_03598 [Streptomyces sp. 769]|nr:hypothetical protein GZL_03598 [Streptomyces sp. 769]
MPSLRERGGRSHAPESVARHSRAWEGGRREYDSNRCVAGPPYPALRRTPVRNEPVRRPAEFPARSPRPSAGRVAIGPGGWPCPDPRRVERAGPGRSPSVGSP